MGYFAAGGLCVLGLVMLIWNICHNFISSSPLASVTAMGIYIVLGTLLIEFSCKRGFVRLCGGLFWGALLLIGSIILGFFALLEYSRFIQLSVSLFIGIGAYLMYNLNKRRLERLE